MKTTAAQTAKAVRTELKQLFPSIKFRVVSESYSGGNSVNVEYTDALPAKEIEKALSKYQQGHFNSMEDIYEYSNSNDNIPQVKYLFVNRRMSEIAKEELLTQIKTTYAGAENVTYEDYLESFRERVCTLVYRLFVQKSFI
mgnify:CR=1 FL=1